MEGSTALKNPFWNPEQRRLRAAWRLLIQGILFLLIALAASVTLGFVLGIWMVVSGAGLPTTPERLGQLMSLPLARLASLGVLGAAWLSVWLAGRFLDRRRFADFGFHLSPGWWLDLGFGLALGAVLMAGVFLLEWALGWVSVTGLFQAGSSGVPFLPGLLLALASFVAVGIYEELLSRGYQLRNLAEGLNWRFLGPRGGLIAAWALSSVVFGALHIGNPNATAVSTLNLILTGLFLGLGYVLTGELAIPIGVHITWNLFQGNVFGFPVSGAQAGATVIEIAQRGPALWTGGAFGPEAGLVGILALIVGSALIVAWVRWRRGEVGLCARLAGGAVASGGGSYGE